MQEAVSSDGPPAAPSGSGSGGASRRTSSSQSGEAAAAAATAAGGGSSPPADAAIRPQRDGVQVAALRSMSDTRIAKFKRLLDEQERFGGPGWSVGAHQNCRRIWVHAATVPLLAASLQASLTMRVCLAVPVGSAAQALSVPPLRPAGSCHAVVKLSASPLLPIRHVQVVDLEALRELTWSGIPVALRPTCWRLLLGYLPPNRERRAQVRRKLRSGWVGSAPCPAA